MLALVAIISVLYLLILSAVHFLSSQDHAKGHAKDSLEEKIARIDVLLPQTQCGDCGYPGCLPYARAIVEEKAPLHLCTPGGEMTARGLRALLGKTSSALDGDYDHTPSVALIDEEACIGCVKCIVACPVDAIIGSAKQLHVVIPQYCTGCKLCVSPCPVDCISMVGRDATLLQKPTPGYGAGR